MSDVDITAGAAGKASIRVEAKGAALAFPPLPLSMEPTVRVQLLGPTNVCWEASFVEGTNTAKKVDLRSE